MEAEAPPMPEGLPLSESSLPSYFSSSLAETGFSAGGLGED